MSYPIGSLITARGREWVVQPGSDDDLLLVRPVAGTEDESTGIALSIEGDDVAAARLDLPDPTDVGDYRRSRLLRDAVRIGFRSSAGPFRSFGRIAVDPRPYQLVPLLMALKLDPVRLLIADDVGIGKTVEALLIARELLDQGSIRRMAVLCSPQLAEQWQREMREKFHLDAALVLPGKAERLEAGLAVDESLFDLHPITVVSTDYIKSDRRRNDFLQFAPELIIVDEAHTCVNAGGYGGRGRTQRHELLKGLVRDDSRNLLMLTATPHSGKHEAFTNLLGLLDEKFLYFPEDLSGPEKRPHREALAQHYVQRRRPDIVDYLGEDTPFPERFRAEETYRLSDEYRSLFDQAVRFARTVSKDRSGGRSQQRVRWWSALALLRSIASSPAAAVATLRNRAQVAAAGSVEEADEIGRGMVLDELLEDDSSDAVDVPPGSDFTEQDADPVRRKLHELARQAEAITPRQDAKLQHAIQMVRRLLADGFNPILFCKFIPTAEYLAEQLRDALEAEVAIAAVTGTLAPPERELRVEDLGQHVGPRVLVATDCLSEGINLQRHFNAVIHYDLAWNPTRHEQREGRVDRFFQPSDEVRLIMFYGEDNRIDLGVKRVLLDKHEQIRKNTGVAVPVPGQTASVVESLSWEVLLGDDFGAQLSFEDLLSTEQRELFAEWERVADVEKRSRAMFAQHAMDPDEVAREVEAARAAVGGPDEVRDFLLAAIQALGGTWQQLGDRLKLDLSGTASGLHDRLPGNLQLYARFDPPVGPDEEYLTRSHPLVESIASHILDSAMDPFSRGVAARAGAVRTAGVATRTTLVFVRYRFDLTQTTGETEQTLLAEDCRVFAFSGRPGAARWLPEEEARRLLSMTPADNVTRDQSVDYVQTVVDGWEHLEPHIAEVGEQLADDLVEQHRRVRDAARRKGVRFRARAHEPADVLGIYVLLPAGG
jgi:superfamily II DNA or RNA helicase